MRSKGVELIQSKNHSKLNCGELIGTNGALNSVLDFRFNPKCSRIFPLWDSALLPPKRSPFANFVRHPFSTKRHP